MFIKLFEQELGENGSSRYHWADVSKSWTEPIELENNYFNNVSSAAYFRIKHSRAGIDTKSWELVKLVWVKISEVEFNKNKKKNERPYSESIGTFNLRWWEKV